MERLRLLCFSGTVLKSLIPLKYSNPCRIIALWIHFIDIITVKSYFAENLGRIWCRRGPACQSTNAYVASWYVLWPLIQTALGPSTTAAALVCRVTVLRDVCCGKANLKHSGSVLLPHPTITGSCGRKKRIIKNDFFSYPNSLLASWPWAYLFCVFSRCLHIVRAKSLLLYLNFS